MPTRRRIVVTPSDTHAGHRLGLLQPGTELIDAHDEPYCLSLTRTQQHLYELYTSHIEEVTRLADGSPVVVIHNGDLCQGTRYTYQLCATRIVDQVVIAVANMNVWFEKKGLNLEEFWIIVGSQAHTFGEGSAAVAVADRLRIRYPGVKVRVVYHLLYEADDGLFIDCAHRGPHPGTRKHLKGNRLRYYLVSAMQEALIDGAMPARVYIRAHYHEYRREYLEVRSKGQLVQSDIVLLPSYSGIDDYVRSATRSKPMIDWGLAAFEVEAGKLRSIVPMWEEYDVRTWARRGA